MRFNGVNPRRARRRIGRWARRSNFVLGLLILVVAMILIVGLPVILPLVAVLHARDLRRRRIAAGAFACIQCGEILGTAALDRADADWAEHLARLYGEHPGIRFRVVREVDAICTRCGTRYRYDEKSVIFFRLAA